MSEYKGLFHSIYIIIKGGKKNNLKISAQCVKANYKMYFTL